MRSITIINIKSNTYRQSWNEKKGIKGSKGLVNVHYFSFCFHSDWLMFDNLPGFPTGPDGPDSPR